MRKSFICTFFSVVVLVLFSPLSAEAQTSKTYYSYQPYWLSEHDVIREYHYPVTISSSIAWRTCNSIFSYNGFNGSNYYLTFLYGYSVNDFVIENDTVFFCGKGDDENGVIGFFPIQGFLNNNVSFFVSKQIECNTGVYASEFNRLVTYRDTTGRRHVVSVGQATGEGKTYPCIADVFSEPMIGYLSYNAAIIDDTTLANSMMDIKRFCTEAYPAREDATRPYLPCDYLIVAGVDANDYLCLRFFNTQDLFSVTGLQNRLYTFDGYDSFVNRRFVSEAIVYPKTDHSIAVAAVLKYNFMLPNHLNTLDIGEVDIFQLLAGAANSMTQSSSVNVPSCRQITSLNEFVYNNSTSSCAVLFNGISNEDSNRASYFVETTGSAGAVLNAVVGADAGNICGDKGFTGLDFFNSKSQYVLFGHCRDHTWQYNHGIETSGTASNCLPSVGVSCIRLTPPTSHSSGSEVKKHGGRNVVDISTCVSTIYGSNEDCSR